MLARAVIAPGFRYRARVSPGICAPSLMAAVRARLVGRRTEISLHVVQVDVVEVQVVGHV